MPPLSVRDGTNAIIALYNYFSAQTHAAPMSMMRFKLHDTDFFEPSDAQKSIVCSALNIAEMCLVRVAVKHFDLSPRAQIEVSKLASEHFRMQALDWESALSKEPP